MIVVVVVFVQTVFDSLLLNYIFCCRNFLMIWQMIVVCGRVYTFSGVAKESKNGKKKYMNANFMIHDT